MGHWLYRIIPTTIRQQRYIQPHVDAPASYQKNEDGTFTAIEEYFNPINRSKWEYNDKQETWQRNQIVLIDGQLKETTVYANTPLSVYIEEMNSEVKFAKEGLGFVHSVKPSFH